MTGARVLAGLLSLTVLVTSGWGWYLGRVADSSVSRTAALPATGNDDARGGEHAGREMNLLLVGTDSRSGLDAGQQAELSTGDADGLLNTDTMLLVHVPADGSAASFVSLPRDVYVPVPGHGEAKLNSAYSTGHAAAAGTGADPDAAGAQLLVQTVSQLTGLEVDHYAAVDLLGFFDLSTLVGGVQVNLCSPVDDDFSGAHFPAGVQTIGGAEALQFVRQRHGLPRGDLDRVVRQQVYIAGLLRNVLSDRLLLDLGRQKQIVEQVGRSVTVDDGLDVFDLAFQMQGLQASQISFQTLPGLTDARVEGWGAVLRLPDRQVVTDFFASLSAGPAAAAAPEAPAGPAPAAPADVTVSVRNGSGITGAGAQAAEALTTAAFRASAAGNEPAQVPATTIRAHPGDDGRAAAVAQQVPGAAVVADDAVAAGTVELVIGADFAGIGRPVTPAAVQAASTPDLPADSYATSERNAEGTSCIA